MKDLQRQINGTKNWERIGRKVDKKRVSGIQLFLGVDGFAA